MHVISNRQISRNTSNPKTIHYDAYLSEAEAIMKARKIHSLVAVDDNNKVVGLIEFSS